MPEPKVLLQVRLSADEFAVLEDFRLECGATSMTEAVRMIVAAYAKEKADRTTAKRKEASGVQPKK